MDEAEESTAVVKQEHRHQVALLMQAACQEMIEQPIFQRFGDLSIRYCQPMLHVLLKLPSVFLKPFSIVPASRRVVVRNIVLDL